MAFAGWLVFLTSLTGTVGYHTLGSGYWSWEDCLYMTVITLSTVGFGETLPGMDQVPYARLWTVVLIVFGSGILLYFVSTLTAFIVEIDLGGTLRRSRMKNEIDQLSGHYVVCGCGNTGLYIVRELLQTERKFVVVDRDVERVEHVAVELGAEFLFVEGDATDDDILRAAGVERASGVVAALHDDPENLYVTLSARALNPSARIVSKAVEVGAQAKMLRAGANSVVLPHFIGGVRMVSEMIRPQVVQFLDRMLQQAEHPLRIEEVVLPAGSRFDGLELRQADLRGKADALLLAIEHTDGTYQYNPPSETRLSSGMRLIVIAPKNGLDVLRGAHPAG